MGRNHYGKATGKTYRLSVCLKRFFSDERARCYITADSGLHFRWLVARMRRLFGLSGPFCLVARGHLLPPDEPVGLLSPDDLVEVIPKHYKMFPDTSESEESEIIYDLYGAEIEKPENTVPLVAADQSAKENQHNQDNGSDETDACQSRNSAKPEQCPPERKGLQEVKNDDLQNIEIRNYNNMDNGKLAEEGNEKLEEVKRRALELLDQCSIPPKRKRKRVRRRKPCTATEESEDNNADNELDVHDAPDSASSAPTDIHTVTASGNDERSTSPQQADTLILRNNMDQRRTPRLVHSVS